MQTFRKWHSKYVPDVLPLWKLVNAVWDAIVNKRDATVAFETAIEALRKCICAPSLLM